MTEISMEMLSDMFEIMELLDVWVPLNSKPPEISDDDIKDLVRRGILEHRIVIMDGKPTECVRFTEMAVEFLLRLYLIKGRFWDANSRDVSKRSLDR